MEPGRGAAGAARGSRGGRRRRGAPRALSFSFSASRRQRAAALELDSSLPREPRGSRAPAPARALRPLLHTTHTN